MPRSLRLSLLVVLPAALALAADAPPTLPTMDALQAASLKDAKWTAPKAPEIPPGVMVAPIASDPAPGGNIGYAKYPPGYTFPMHWHSATEFTTVISGKLQYVIDGKSYDLEAGGYIVIPAKANHLAKCGAGVECIVVTRRGGPTDYHWVK
jgi:quercetin dioxygenase-like cupin family protein